MKRPLRIVAVVLLATSALLILGSVAVTGTGPGDLTGRRPSGAIAAADTGASAGSIATGIDGLRARVEDVPGDWTAWAGLGLAYVQQARVTGDPTSYDLAESALATSWDIERDGNCPALVGRSALAAARHDFTAALANGLAARRINPHNFMVHAVVGDALIELGEYDRAFASYQRMVDLGPGLTSFARVSYAYELRGDTDRAIEAMTAARAAATGAPDIAFAEQHLGDLHWSRGDIARARVAYTAAAAAAPDYLPPKVGLARIAAATGDARAAARAYRDVIAVAPLPEYLAEYADLLAANGDTDEVADIYEVLDAQRQLLTANGVNVDLEIALAEADRGDDVAGALEAARAEWVKRHSIHVADALAWALHVNGRDEQALRYARSALRLGTENALFHFHRGMIELELGRVDAGRRSLATALEINPNFSHRWASVARSELEAATR